jgi:hypothetical protein
MEPQANDDLFRIRINATAKPYINRFAFMVRIIILIGIVITFIHIASSTLWLLQMKKFDLVPGSARWYEYKILPYYVVIHCLLFYIYAFFYWQASKFLRKGIKYDSEEMFNKAFKSLFRYAAFAIVSLILSTISYGYELYVFIKDYSR